MTAGLDQHALTAAALPGPGGTRPDTQAEVLRRRFPPRPAATVWPQTRLSRQEVAGRLLAARFAAEGAAGEDNRRRGLRLVVDWLETQPGDYVWVPPHVPHREENPSVAEAAVVVIARSTQEAIVVSVAEL